MNTKNQITIPLALGLILIVSCKKKTSVIEDTPPVIQSEASPRTDSINGQLTTAKYYTYKAGQVNYERVENFAMFTNTLTSSENFWLAKTEDIGFVNINQINLSIGNEEGLTMYLDPLRTYCTAPIKWKVDGKNGFTSFTYVIDYSHPEFEGIKVIPDSINVNSAYTFLFVGTDAENINVRFECGCSELLTRAIKYPTRTMTLSSLELSRLSDYGLKPITAIITLEKILFNSFGGKHYKFVTQTIIRKFIYPKSTP